MVYFKIGNTDFSSYVSSLKTDFEVLVSSDSGRNAKGDTVLDIVNRKDKLVVTFKPLTQSQMQSLLSAIENFKVDVTYRNPRTGNTKTIHTYTGTASPEYYRIIDNKILYKPMNLDFIEL